MGTRLQRAPRIFFILQFIYLYTCTYYYSTFTLFVEIKKHTIVETERGFIILDPLRTK